MYEPFNLPEMACFQYQKGGKRKHWFCYVRRLDVDTQLRVAGNGFWKRRDAERNVIGGGIGRVVVGRRKTYVFYLWNDNNTAARKTEWLMYEYDLIGHPNVSSSIPPPPFPLPFFFFFLNTWCVKVYWQI